jgi:predicted HicB family RNase H-like nuclease
MSSGTKNKSGFQMDPDALKGIPPRKLVQMNTLQPSQTKRWALKEAKRRGISLSQFIRQCLTAVKENPSLLD